jgi:hypothetical protein
MVSPRQPKKKERERERENQPMVTKVGLQKLDYKTCMSKKEGGEGRKPVYRDSKELGEATEIQAKKNRMDMKRMLARFVTSTCDSGDGEERLLQVRRWRKRKSTTKKYLSPS